MHKLGGLPPKSYYNGMLRQLNGGGGPEEGVADFRYKGYPNDFMISPRSVAPPEAPPGQSWRPAGEVVKESGAVGASDHRADWVDETKDIRRPIPRNLEAEDAITADLRRFRQQQQQKKSERDEHKFNELSQVTSDRNNQQPPRNPSLESSMQSLGAFRKDSESDAAGNVQADRRDGPETMRQEKQQGDAVGRDRAGLPSPSYAAGTGLVLHKPYGGGGGDPQHTASGRIRTRFPITMSRDKYGNSMTAESPFSLASRRSVSPEHGKEQDLRKQAADGSAYFPFGRPGAGAPLRNVDGSVAPQIRGKMLFNDSADAQKRQRAANAYLLELKHEMEIQERQKLLKAKDDKMPVEGFASLIQHGRVGQPRRDPETGLLSDQHNPATDVTKLKVGQVLTPTGNPRVYHDDLTALAKERHRLRELDRIRERHEDINHEMHWKELWGRPGGGAPNAAAAPTTSHADHKRANLDRMLFHADSSRGSISQGYVKNTLHGIQELSPSHYQKNYIQSNHANSYQMESASRGSRLAYARQPQYSVAAPFATDIGAHHY